jgi:hypothetical protein
VFCKKFPRGQMEWLEWNWGKCFAPLILVEQGRFTFGLMERLSWS